LKHLRCIFILLFFFSISADAQDLSDDFEDLKSAISSDHSDSRSSGSIDSGSQLVLAFYQNMISPHDNTSCPFHPNCSEFSRQAFRKENFATGYLLTFDRLLRCNGLPGMYGSYPLDENRRYFIDPAGNYTSSE